MKKFSKHFLEILHQAGWNENRIVDLTAIKHTYTVNGFDMPPAIESFIASFLGVEIKYKTKNNTTGLVHFNIGQAIDEVDPDWVFKVYENKIHEKLYIIGQCYSDHVVLMMNKSGEVYGGFDHLFYFIGNDIETAVENIINDEKLPAL